MTAGGVVDELAGVVDEAMADHAVPGVAVGISAGGQRAFLCRGVTNVEHPLPITEATRFQIGSVTKTFTATGLLRLAEDNRLDLDAPISDALPDLRVQDTEHLAGLTAHRLLCHLSGIFGDWILHGAPDFGAGDDALGRMVDQLDQVPFLTAPGRAFSYSNTGYCLAGHLLAVITGTTYEAAIDMLLLGPAGLHDTTFSAEDAITHRVAIGHHRDDHGNASPARGGESWSPRWALQRAANPAGGLISTPDDLLTWTEQTLTTGPVISEWARDTMLAVQCPSGGQGTHAGLGWHHQSAGGQDVWSHNGVTDGYVTYALIVPAKNVAAVILTNCSMGHRVIQQTRTAILETLDLGPEQADPDEAPPADMQLLAGTYADPIRELRLHPTESGHIAIEFQMRDRIDEPLGPTQTMTAAWTSDGRLTLTSPQQRVGQGLEYPTTDTEDKQTAAWIRFRGRLHPRTTESRVTDHSRMMLH